MKYVKVIFGNKGADYEYKIDEVNIANKWNPNAKREIRFLWGIMSRNI